MSKLRQVGLDRRIKLEWLERTASLVSSNKQKHEIQEALAETLQGQVSGGGKARRGSREKTITNLIRIWVSVPKACESLRDDGLALLQKLPVSAHLPVHWGMTMAVYPFFATVAETAGRLLKLQASVTTFQVQRRVQELFGQRETVVYAVQKLLASMVNWGVLSTADKKGNYRGCARHAIKNIDLAVWMLEAVLMATNGNQASIRDISNYPGLFPFELPLPKIRDLESHERLETFRQGFGEEIVMLRKKG